MRNVFITTVAAMAISTAAFAEDTVTKVTTPVAPVLSGKVSLDFAETAGDKIGGTMGVELDINAGSLATVDLDFKATDGNSLTLDTWTVGTEVAGVGVALGDDNNLMPETAANATADGTLAKPAMTESVALSFGGASIAVGLTDYTTDITEVSNVQGAYTMGVAGVDVTAAADYNMDSENTVLGAGVAGIDLGVASLGGAATYDMDAEVFGFEGVVTSGGITAYLNGDDTDALQNIGGEYEINAAGVKWAAGANYNVDTEDFAPTASIGFAF